MDGANVCRMCGSGTDLIGIYEDKTSDSNICELIQRCVPLVVTVTDPFTKSICTGCIQTMKEYRVFLEASLKLHWARIENLRNIDTNTVDMYLNDCQAFATSFGLLLIEKAPHKTKTHATHMMSQIDVPPKRTTADEMPRTVPHLRKICLDIINKNLAILCRQTEEISCNVLDDRTEHLAELNSSITSSGLNIKVEEAQSPDLPVPVSTNVSILQSLLETNGLDKQQCNIEGVALNLAVVDPPQDDPLATLTLNPEISISLNNKPLPKEIPLYCTNPESIIKIESVSFQNKPVPIKGMRGFKCSYCTLRFMNRSFLAMHEINHINVVVGPRVDDIDFVDLYSNSVDISTVAPVPLNTNSVRNAEKPLLIPLSNQNKDIGAYPTVMVNGQKRKLCVSCKHTFKDNYAVRNHLTSGACRFCCRICGQRFRKNSRLFALHMAEHDRSPGMLTSPSVSKVSATVVSDSVAKAPTNMQTSTPKVEPLKMKNLFERHLYKSVTLTTNTRKTRSSAELSPVSQIRYCKHCNNAFISEDALAYHQPTCYFTPNLDIHNQTLSEPEHRQIPKKKVTSLFDCSICFCSFPSRFSRNSHMRVHKSRVESPSLSPLHSPPPISSQSPLPSSNDSSFAVLSNNPFITIKPTFSVTKVEPPEEEQNIPLLPRNYRCLQCNGLFPNKSVLYKHKQFECRKVCPYKCPFCGIACSSEHSFNQHILLNHPEN